MQLSGPVMFKVNYFGSKRDSLVSGGGTYKIYLYRKTSKSSLLLSLVVDHFKTLNEHDSVQSVKQIVERSI